MTTTYHDFGHNMDLQMSKIRKALAIKELRIKISGFEPTDGGGWGWCIVTS